MDGRSFRDALRSPEGAIDLASIMVGVLVIGIIGGIIAATVFSVIPWSQNEAAKGNLDAVKTAESATRAMEGTFVEYDSHGDSEHRAFEIAEDEAGNPRSAIQRPENRLIIDINQEKQSWIAVSKSATGDLFAMTSDSPEVFPVEESSVATIAAGSRAAAPAPAWDLDGIDLPAGFENGTALKTMSTDAKLDDPYNFATNGRVATALPGYGKTVVVNPGPTTPTPAAPVVIKAAGGSYTQSQNSGAFGNPGRFNSNFETLNVSEALQAMAPLIGSTPTQTRNDPGVTLTRWDITQDAPYAPQPGGASFTLLDAAGKQVMTTDKIGAVSVIRYAYDNGSSTLTISVNAAYMPLNKAEFDAAIAATGSSYFISYQGYDYYFSTAGIGIY